MTKESLCSTSEPIMSCSTTSESSLVYRLRKRAEIRRSISSRKSVQEGLPDRIANLLEEAADALDRLGYRDNDEQQGQPL